MPDQRPLLLLDVDGVLNPFAADGCPPGYQEFPFFPDEDPVWLCPGHADWLRELAGHFEIVWVTAWGHEANTHIAPVLGLPRLPVIEFPPIPFHPREKVPAVASFVGDHPAAWIDDSLTQEAREWAASRTSPTLLLDIDAAIGLTRAAVDTSLRWAQAHRR